MGEVTIVMWFDAEPYETASGIYRVFSNPKAAIEFYHENTGKVLDADEDGYGGVMLLPPETWEVE
jgi:hypothetical protein